MEIYFLSITLTIQLLYSWKLLDLFDGENHKHLRILKWNEQTFEFFFVETTS